MNATHGVVQHNSSAQRFELGSGADASLLEYTRKDGLVIFTHTFVPPALRGRDLAEKLVRTALAWARSENLIVIPQCSYVARFIEHHHEYADLLAQR